MGCNKAGKKKSTYTGNQVGDLNYTGDYNFVAGGPPGSGLSAGTTVVQFIPNSQNRSPWLRDDAKFDDKLLDAAYPTIDLQWFADITLSPGVVFRVSDRAFPIISESGEANFYDARCDKAPGISVTVGEWLSPKYQISDLSMSLNNRDGLYNDYLPLGDLYQQWTNATVEIYIGFGEKRSNYMSIFQGRVAVNQGLTTTRDTIDLKVNNKVEGDQIPLPPRSFSSDTFPDISPDTGGKPVPLVYGDWSENVPEYGSIPAYCTNALEEDAEQYNFKISDLDLMSIDSIWLHRGERAALKPQGPIRIADNVVTRREDAGEFLIPSSGVVLDEPYYIGTGLKAGVGSSGAIITADNDYNFVAQGVKVGDKIVNGSPINAQLTLENLLYKSTITGASGNNIAIEYYFLSPDNSVDQTKCYAIAVPGVGTTTIRVGVPQGLDKDLNVVQGIHTAGAIKAAIYANTETRSLVRVIETGTVPISYPEGTKISQVDQTIPQGPTFLSGGQDATYYQTILSVSNFQITVDGIVSFSEGDEYNISTTQYKFLTGDKFSVVCQGKKLNIVSVNRITDVSSDILQPEGFRVASDSTIWMADDATQKVYNFTFDKQILRTIDYSQIDVSLVNVSGLDVASDNKLWVTDPDNSKIYRYDLLANQTGLSIVTGSITGMVGDLENISGISVETNNQFWIVDKATSQMYLIDAFSAVNPFIVTEFNSDVANVNVSEILDICVDNTTDTVTFVDRTTNSFYRVEKADGTLVSSFPLTNIADNISFATGLSIAQDGTIFVVDQGLLSFYNYNDMDGASSNPAIIARDLLQKFGGHTYDEFDLSFMQTARQLSDFKSRSYLSPTVKMVDAINSLLKQFNAVFHLRFNKYALFWIDFSNFRTTGRTVKEKDIKEGTFKPGRENNQYFNSATSTYSNDPFAGSSLTSDTYVSPAAISFAGGETNRKFDMPSVYRRSDIDRLMPLFIKLSIPDPEFVTVTFNFRQIRTQMQDFINIIFDGDVNCKTGRKESGRRYNNVPAMVRSLKYDLNAGTVEMKLWSLGNTSFPGYEAQGRTVGGVDEPIVLSNIGRLGRISPAAYITSNDTNSITTSNVYGVDAQDLTQASAGLAWKSGHKVDLVDGVTKEILQTLTIDTVVNDVITFVEDITATVSATTLNAAGFINGGTYAQYSTYVNATIEQRQQFASFTRPSTNYPTSKTQELEEQRGGLHNFDDGGVPYVLYPNDFTEY